MNYKDFRKINKPSERQIQTEIMNYLLSKGYYVLRLNSGAIRTDKGHLVRMAKAGTPDIMAFKKWGQPDVHAVHIVFIEVKIPGAKPTMLQEMKMKELQEFGARCIVAHSIEELKSLL
jgi:hypothetical protein